MNPIMREIPYAFNIERLTIRGPLPGDGVMVRTAVLESQAEFKPWMPWAVNVASLHTAHTGEGYITEAVKGICQFAFTHLEAQRLLIRCNTENERSAAVARRCDFNFEGTHWHDSRDHITNEVISTHYFSKLAA